MDSPQQSQWEQACQEELASILKNKVWTEVHPTHTEHPNIIGRRWVIKIQYEPKGEVQRFKARLVAKGYTQSYCIIYLETFSPVVNFQTLRLLLVLAVSKDFDIHTMDIQTAFLAQDQSSDEQAIYMELPPGISRGPQEEVVLQLHKTLYGLKQSSRVFNKALHGFFTLHGLQRGEADHCIYFNASRTLFLMVYVDDLVLIGNLESVQSMKKKLNIRFQMSDLGPLSYFLEIAVIRDENEHHLSQERYMEEILRRFQFSSSHPCSIPLSPGTKLKKESGAVLSQHDSTLYRSIVGSIMYLMLATRQDLSYAVGAVSQFSSAPSIDHLAALHHILRYIRVSAHLQLYLTRCSAFEATPQATPLTKPHYPKILWDTKITGYSDSDRAGCLDSHHSTGAYIFLAGQLPVTWSSKAQPTVALSSTEAEYMALTQATKEAIQLHFLLSEILDCQYKKLPSITIFADNQGCIALAYNPEDHAPTKHIDIQHHFVREKVEGGEVSLEYTPIGVMVADCLTKALPREKFVQHRASMAIN